jgi:ABC-2 type transport system ATP-binding protein
VNPIEIDHLTKQFGHITAVCDLTLQVSAGEVVGLLGPNGAGKTTTLRTLLGFLHPTSGRCTVLGTRPSGEVAVRRRIGYLPGDFRIDAAMRPAELFDWFGRLRGDRRTGGSPNWSSSSGWTRRFGTLSKGNRQKVGLVQAFCHDPDLLILDEPTTGLDPLVQREFHHLVQDAAGRGAAILLSSHVLPEVEHIATRIAIIRAGRLATIAGVGDLLAGARHRLALRFADTVPPDLFDGVPGVAETELDGHTAVITVDGPVEPALRAALAGPRLLRIASAGDDLEDLFVSLYYTEPEPTRS